jgi:hypothetical protein
MDALPKLGDIPAILQTGLSGLAFLLALLSYNLLAREQRATKPRAEILRAARTFLVTCVLFALLVGGFQITERLLRPVDSELVANCRRALDNLRLEQRSANTLDELRGAVAEQDQVCAQLVSELAGR